MCVCVLPLCVPLTVTDLAADCLAHRHRVHTRLTLHLLSVQRLEGRHRLECHLWVLLGHEEGNLWLLGSGHELIALWSVNEGKLVSSGGGSDVCVLNVLDLLLGLVSSVLSVSSSGRGSCRGNKNTTSRDHDTKVVRFNP